MKLYVIFAQRKCSYDGQYAPEALHVVDEYSRDDNPAWIEERLAETLEDNEIVAAEIVEIDLGDEGFKAIEERLTNCLTVKGTVGD